MNKSMNSPSAVYRGAIKGLWASFATLELAFLYVPVVVLIIFSFNDNSIMRLPLSGFTFEWYVKAFTNEDILDAIKNSFIVASATTILTLLIGIPAALSIDRLNFPGKSVFNKIILLPIALPGVITGISLLSFLRSMDIGLTLFTVILGHTAALSAITVTQILARLRRFNRRLEDASADLGANSIQTFFFGNAA